MGYDGPGMDMDLGEVARRAAEMNKKKLKSQIANEAGVDVSAVNDSNLSGVKTALEGARTVADSGDDPRGVPVNELKQVATGKPDETPDEDLSNQQKITMALTAILPTIAGFAFGGKRGGAVGAEAASKGVTGYISALGEERKLKLAQKEKADELGIKRSAVTFDKEKQTADQANKDRDYNQKEREISAKSLEGKNKAQELLNEKGEKKKTGDRDFTFKLSQAYNDDKTTLRTKDIGDSFARMSSAMEVDPGLRNKEGQGIRDLTLIYAYNKMLDPGSGVKEGEVMNAKNAASLPEKLRTAYNSVLSGDSLDDATREAIVSQAKALYQGQLASQAGVINKYKKDAEAAGVDPSLVVTEFSHPALNEKRKVAAPTREETGTLDRIGNMLSGQRAQARSSSIPPIKPPEEMTQEELDAEEARLLGAPKKKGK